MSIVYRTLYLRWCIGRNVLDIWTVSCIQRHSFRVGILLEMFAKRQPLNLVLGCVQHGTVRSMHARIHVIQKLQTFRFWNFLVSHVEALATGVCTSSLQTAPQSW